MKKVLKITLIVIGILIGIILLDSIQALVFNNNPIIGIETRGMKREGILVDTHHCGNGKHDTVIKGFSYSCTYDADITIIDKTKDIKDFTCAEALEEFYRDAKYVYYYNCIKSNYIVVRYNDGTEETVKDALKNNHIEIGDLDKFDINYIKQEK